MPAKRRLNSRTLEENGIIFSKKVYRHLDEYLDCHFPQASIVTQGLLAFEHILSQSSFEKLSKRNQTRIDTYFKFSKIPHIEGKPSMDPESYEERYQITDHNVRFDLAQSIAKNAKHIRSAKETRWTTLLKNEIFGNLIQSARRAEGIKVFDPRQLVEKIRVEDEDLWRNGRRALQQTTPPGATPLTAPKVDLYLALPIIRRTSNARGFHRDNYIQNFTETALTSLEEDKNGKLISNPIRPMNTLKDISRKDLVCFPSAVIEVKHHKVKKKEKEKCYWQAANAASAALSMLGRLAHLSTFGESFGEIQPVVAFTFIGYKCRVWIAFISGRACKHQKLRFEYDMRCIWKGDLRNVWDTVQLCRIIENVHYWTVRHFRPWVSSCLDRWNSAVKAFKNKDSLGALKDLQPKSSSQSTTSTGKDEDEEYEDEEDEDKEDEDEEYEDEEDEDEEDEDEEDEDEEDEDEEDEDEEDEDDGSNEDDDDEEDYLTDAFEERMASDSARGSHSTQQGRRQANIISSEVSYRIRSLLHPNEMSELPLRTKDRKRHARSHSTGET